MRGLGLRVAGYYPDTGESNVKEMEMTWKLGLNPTP